MRISAILGLLLLLSLYDKLVKYVSEFPVNLNILYHNTWHLFALIVAIIFYIDVDKFSRKIIIVASLPLLLRFVLNLLAINKDYEHYNLLVSNQVIDYLTWISLSIIIIVLLWRRFLAIQ